MLKCNFNDCDCDHSGTSPERDNKIIKCPDCEIVEYCSEKCFRLDRNKHKLECRGSKLTKLSAIDRKSLNDYEFVKNSDGHDIVLGKGAFSEVKLVKESYSGIQYAMKIIKKSILKSQSDIDHLLREIRIHKKLSHPNIIRLYHFFETTDYVYLIQEYAPNTLSIYLKKIKKFTEEKAFPIFFQVCLAIDLLHQCKIIHRDIKPENLLIDMNGNIKLCDFGWCGKLEDERSTFCGTLDYLSPEIVSHDPQTEKVDIWCLGILLYELVMGYPPFASKNIQDKMHDMKYNINLTFSPKITCSSEIKDLIIQMLDKKADNRPTITEIFSHPWMLHYTKKLDIDINKYLELSKNPQHSISLLRKSEENTNSLLEKKSTLKQELSSQSEIFLKSKKIDSTNEISESQKITSLDNIPSQLDEKNKSKKTSFKKLETIIRKYSNLEDSMIFPETSKYTVLMKEYHNAEEEIPDIKNQILQLDKELGFTKSANLTSPRRLFKPQGISPETLTPEFESSQKFFAQNESLTNSTRSFNRKSTKNFEKTIKPIEMIEEKEETDWPIKKSSKKSDKKKKTVKKKNTTKKSKEEKNENDDFNIRSSLKKKNFKINKEKEKEIETNSSYTLPTKNEKNEELSFFERMAVKFGCLKPKKY